MVWKLRKRKAWHYPNLNLGIFPITEIWVMNPLKGPGSPVLSGIRVGLCIISEGVEVIHNSSSWQTLVQITSTV